MYKLKIISSTVRPGRKGPSVARWIMEIARSFTEFDVELVDLGELKLPLMDEPNHPSLQQYEHQHTKDWSKQIGDADAFVFVTGEYNFGYPSPLRNALEYLHKEWAYKAAGIVSYGGVSAGTRAANSLKSDLSTLSVVPLAAAVNIPMFSKLINEEGEFEGSDISVKAGQAMLKELVRWTTALKPLRTGDI
ncbi:MAG: NADPH-dependent oxidoreductase [Pedobacter sp.]|nr:MAG: NADPH-dependent oxidoreductase [Pedobacter sp.]